MPPKPCICRCASACCGWLARPGIDHPARRPCGASSHAAIARALSQWRCMRSARVFMPRSARKLSNGPETAPTAFCRKLSRSRSSAFVADHQRAADHVGVAVQVLGRRVHHDVEAELQRALHDRGWRRCCRPPRAGRAALPARRSPPGRPARSIGLVGVSTQIICVSGGSPPRRPPGRRGRRS